MPDHMLDHPPVHPMIMDYPMNISKVAAWYFGRIFDLLESL